MSTKKENNLSDQALVHKVLHGNSKAFSEIIKNTERLVAQIVFKMIANSEDRKDIAQDVYLKAFHKLADFKFQSKLSTWIAQITYNTCINYLQKKKLVLLYEDKEEAIEHRAITNNQFALLNTGGDELLFKKQLTEILATEIDNLSPLYKTILTLYHNEDLSYAEIAQVTALPEGTVKSYLFRARKELRTNLLLNYKKEAL